MGHRTLVHMAALLAAAWCTFVHPQTGGPTELDARAIESALALTQAQRVAVQRGLAELGFDVGPLDGIFGRRTRAAIGRWQASTGNPVTGFLDTASAETLLAAGWRTPPQQDPAKRLRTLKYEARIAAVESLDDRRRATALLALVLEQAASGDFQDALSTARRIDRAYVRSHALTSVAKHQANAGDFRGASRSVSGALALARTIADATDRARALERAEEARATVEEQRERPPDSLPAVPTGSDARSAGAARSLERPP